MADTLLSVHHITKSYPGVLALDDVSFDVRRGEVHALLGENGAGKSTLIKVLAGAIQPDSGRVEFEGIGYDFLEPRQAKDLGIGIIYQEFNLVPSLTVAENIFLGREMRRGWVVRKREQNARARELLDMLRVPIDPAAPVRELSVAYRQIVEIAKAVSKNVKLLILDEPSAPLTTQEVDALFDLVRRLKADGVTSIYISHRLEELFEISDRVTVMRDGRYIATLDTRSTTRGELIALEVGRELSDAFPKRGGGRDAGKVVLDVSNLSCGDKLRGVSFSLHRGEILGISGLVGAGRTELARTIFGADPATSGEIRVDGRQAMIGNPSEAIAHGIGLIPEDRKGQGLLLEMAVGENISFATIRKLSRASVIRRKLEGVTVKSFIDSLRIKTPSSRQRTANLSGGNQQKVVLAKWLAMASRVLIFDEPTRGIDVGAKQEIHRLITDLADAGASILLISSEMPELL